MKSRGIDLLFKLCTLLLASLSCQSIPMPGEGSRPALGHAPLSLQGAFPAASRGVEHQEAKRSKRLDALRKLVSLA